MLFSVVIPTLGNRESELKRLLDSLEKQTYERFEVIIVSQDNHDVVEAIILEFVQFFPIKHIKLDRKGLSIARNAALTYVTGNIVTFSDDDCWYPKEAFYNIKEAFRNLPSQIICFQIFDPISNTLYKDYGENQIEKLRMLQLFQRSSIEIFIKLDGNIDISDLGFNENFGLGSPYPTGEENILLAKLYKLGLTISYINQVVVYHKKPKQESRLGLKAFISKGPLFKEIFGTLVGVIMLTVMFIKKYKYLEQPFNYYQSAIRELWRYHNQ